LHRFVWVTIDDMRPGRHYTIRYDMDSGVEEFKGCRFDGIHIQEFPTGDTAIRGAAVYRADSTPDRMVLWEKDILDITPE
jgi:hypothetical protein